MSQTRPKPQAILDLEQRYSITISNATGQTSPWLYDCYYQCNEEGEITSLKLGKCYLRRIPDLSQFTKLTFLNLEKNFIREIKGLDQLTNLTNLFLWDNRITEIKGLDQLTNLKNLNLAFNHITEIKELDQLTRLKGLDLRFNNITEIRGFDRLTNLKTLNLASNHITEIKGLDKLIYLENLNLGFNHISDIKGLDKLTRLTTLSLRSNYISKINGLNSLKKLKRLELQGNNISQVKNLRDLKQLVHIEIDNDKIALKSDLRMLDKFIYIADGGGSRNGYISDARNFVSRLCLCWLDNRWLWLSSLIWIFIWGVLGNFVIDFFDEYLLPTLTRTSHNTIYQWLCIPIWAYSCYLIFSKKTWNYRIPSPILSFGILFCAVYWINRKAYISLPDIIFGIGYGDTLIFLLSICVISLLLSQMRRSWRIQDLQDHCPSEFMDRPISSSRDDRLDYEPIAQKLSKEILSLNTYFYSYSIGVIAPWGSGKTSFLNLLKESLNGEIRRQELLLIEFNPRLSKNAAHIQEDFFSLLFSALGKYDLRFSSVFYKYLQAIDVVAKSSIFSFKLSSLIDREIEKKHINQAIKEVNKPIVILIDDLDRLLADEILEVFKLIRGNADFFNVLFVVAYDKDYVNRMLHKVLYNQDLNFTDKFCSREITLPLRPYKILIEELRQGFLKDSRGKDKLKVDVANTIKELEYYLPRSLSTMRDLKRFLNSFIPAFREIKDDLLFRDYFILQLIKYKSYSCYVDLMNGKLTYIEGDIHKLKENPNDSFQIDLLRLLLSPSNYSHSRSICQVRSFHLYFYESPYGIIKMEDLESLITKLSSVYEVTQYLDNILKEYGVAHITDSLKIYERDNWTADQLKVYFLIIFYLESTDSRNKYLKLSVATRIRLKSNAQTMRVDQKTYKSALVEALREIGLIMGYNATEEDLSNFILDGVTKDNYILTTDEMKEVSRKLFEAAFREKRLSPSEIMKLWGACLAERDSQNPDHILLDKNVRQLLGDKVKDEPHEYLEYLFTGEEEGEVQINVFWEQVLSREDLEELVLEYAGNKHQEIKDYWERFKANGYSKVDSNGKMI